MLSNIRISTRISGGFFLILVLLTALAIFAYSSTDRLGTYLQRFNVSSEVAFSAAGARYSTVRALLAAHEQFETPNAENRQAYMEWITTARARAEDFLSSGFASADQFATILGDYSEKAGHAVMASEQRLETMGLVESLGIEHRRNIGQLNEMLETRAATDLAYTALRASEAFLVARVRVDRYLAGAEIEEFESASRPLATAQSLLQSLSAGALMAEERALLATAREGVIEWQRATIAARDAEARFRQIVAEAEAVLPQLQTTLDGIMADSNTYVAELADSSSETVRSTTTLLTISAVLILTAGIGIAALLSIAISRALRMTVGQTRSLADGDLSIDITGTKHRSELGDLSRALLVFKENAEETRRLTAEAETRRTEDDERQKREMARQQRVVSDISSGLDRLAAGDLTRQIESPANDPFPAEYDDLRKAYNAVVEQMAGIVSRIGAVADSVRGGSGEINAASRDLSARAETQAATLEESAAALNQLTESVRSTAQRASSAEKASQDNRTHAETGAQVVREAVNAMKGIERSSEQITRIIGVIDDIAFQTNLLALNAGVEAARAGDAGRGFAVVASEVRGLAQRASESAREIKTLISESASQVEAGSELVNRTGESLEEILRRAAEVSGLVADIAVAASEQASGLDEINTGVNQLDQVTQQNAAVAEETTAAATSLLQKAEELTHELSGFQTGTAGQIVALTPSAKPTGTISAATNWAALKPEKVAAGGNPWRDF